VPPQNKNKYCTATKLERKLHLAALK